MIFLADTSGLVGLTAPADQFRPRARAFVRSRGVRLATSVIVLAETYTFLRSRYDFALARNASRQFMSSSVMTVYQWDNDLDAATWAILDEFSGVPLSYADASLVVLSRHLGIDTVFSFDDDLRQAGLRLVPSA